MTIFLLFAELFPQEKKMVNQLLPGLNRYLEGLIDQVESC